jgi:predicted transcriptional regulator
MKSAIRSVPLKNFHLPIPEDVHEALRREAVALGRPATVIAREAIEEWLRERRRAAVHEAVAAYASGHAGTLADLDPALERASLERWRVGGRRRQ